jgi:hypothetical protein
VPPDSSTIEGWFLKLVQPEKFGLASQEAKPRSPGATRSRVRAVSVKPLELRELMLSFNQPVLAK